MTTIEFNAGKNNYLGLLKKFPKEVLAKINISASIYLNNVEEKIEVVIISGDSVDKVREFVDNLGGIYEDLGYNFGIVTIPIEKLLELATNPIIQYIELPKSLYITDSEANRASCVPAAVSTYKLDGSGILVGFIDTGIDYTHPAFINEDGSTRIEYIYDLDQGGKIYDKNEINEALKSNDPFSIVNSIDVVGHGTHVVGIACAGGKIDKKFYGVAPKSSIAMVKVARTRFGLSTQIMRGIKFLIDKSKELKLSLVINMSLSTNDGAHNGSSLLEKYISIISTLERITIVVAAGNEGEAAHHTSGQLKDSIEIDFNVGEEETIVAINLYKSVLPQISVELICPCAQSTGELFLAEGFISGRIGRSLYEIYDTGPKPFDISGEVGIILKGSEEFISSGLWKIIIKTVNEYRGNFNLWLPISEGLNTKTKFLDPVIYNTLGIPATVENVISVGSYDYLTNIISPFSGRGQKFNGQYIKPDIVAPGEEIYSAIPNKSFDRKTGTSMATPNVSGICALMMQWGIVKQNDLYLYGERLKYYLIVGAKKARKDISYPDPGWGYGEVCIYDSLELTVQGLANRDKSKNNINRQDDNSNNKSQNSNASQTNSNSDNNILDERVFLLAEVPIFSKFQKIVQMPNVSAVMISDTFAIIITPQDSINEIVGLVNNIVKYPLVPILTLSAMSPIEASGAPNFNNNPYLKLKGTGTLVGIVDTGINYLSEEFQREDNTSRIIRLWDQTIPATKEIAGIKYGTEYTEEQITAAIEAKKNGGDPYSIVPSKDEIGHGTMMAGIVGGRGINPDLKGMAPDCEFIIVKLAKANKIALDQSYIESKEVSFNIWDVLLGLRYAVTIANELIKPLVVYIPLGTNMGTHSGDGIVERTIDNYSQQTATMIVANTGNQGNTDTHVEGRIDNTEDIKEIELRVGKNQNRLPIEIYVNRPNIVDLSIISPSGEVINNLNSKLSVNQTIRFTYEATEMVINFISPDYVTGDTLIIIKSSSLREGIWKFRLTGKYIVNCRYDAWIPQRELLDGETKFLNANQDTTLTIPSTAMGTISVSYYNQNNNAIVSESGRGYTRDNRIKPDIAAGGVNATVIKTNGTTGVMTGASVAGAVVTGGCALVLQWAVIDKNQKNIYTPQLKYYMIAGAKTRPGDIYPNREWGYGTFDLNGIFNTIREVYGDTDNSRKLYSEYNEYNVGKLFVRKPINM